MDRLKWLDAVSESTPLHELTPKQFERAVASVLLSNGVCSSAELIGGPDDRGVDIVCSVANGLVVVQCKRYQPGSRITASQIQHFYAMAMHRGAVKSIFVTTSSFTRPAIDQAREFGIELIDGKELMRLIHSLSVPENALVAHNNTVEGRSLSSPVPLHKRKYCIHCGQRIEMRQSAQGQWWPIGLDGTWHRCVPKDFIPRTFAAIDGPATAQTGARPPKKRGWWKRLRGE